MADEAPTLEMYFKRYVRQQSVTRILWNDEKKKAAAKKIDTKVFKLDLGKQLDKLLGLGLAAQDMSKHYGAKDAKVVKSKQAVAKQVAVVKSIITKYLEICRKSAVWEHTPDDQKTAWKSLSSELSKVQANVDTFAKNSTADKVTTKSV